MKLLIVTQAIDADHPILSFFLRWVKEFAKHCEEVHVVCLQEGRHDLPDNVIVHSLGKENGGGRLVYLWRFYKYIWSLKGEYDQVFVHMNQIYVILGWPIWSVFRKRISLWYMHGSVPYSLRVAEKLVDKIFTGSPESFRLKSNKVEVTGHGIDTELFKPLDNVEKDLDIITVGRITPSKNLDTLIDLFAEIRKQKNVTLTIVGSSVTDLEMEYETKLKQKVDSMGLADAVKFYGRVAQPDLPEVLNRAKLFVTVAQNGSLDKVVLEAMACGLPVVSMAPGTMSLKLGEGQVSIRKDFVGKCLRFRSSNKQKEPSDYETLKRHNVVNLIPKLIQS